MYVVMYGLWLLAWLYIELAAHCLDLKKSAALMAKSLCFLLLLKMMLVCLIHSDAVEIPEKWRVYIEQLTSKRYCFLNVIHVAIIIINYFMLAVVIQTTELQ